MQAASAATRVLDLTVCLFAAPLACSWNRQVYIYDDENGNPTVFKKNDTIAFNFILANYHSSMAIDNDDGSASFDTHDNVLISASSGAAYGGNSLKADFGGHDNYHHDNVDLFWSEGFGVCPTLDGHSDGYCAFAARPPPHACRAAPRHRSHCASAHELPALTSLT